MPATPYPSRIRICAAAIEAGHIVGSDQETVTIETGTVTLVMEPGKEIRDTDGKTYSPDEAVRALGLTL